MPESDREQREHQAAQAIEMMGEHGAWLAAQAREALILDPDMRLVGMILAPDSSVMERLRTGLERLTKQSLAGKGFVGLVPREFALNTLRANVPATLDWIEPHNTGPARRLSLMAATRNGSWFGSVAITT